MPWFREPLHWRLRQPDPNGPIRVSIRARIELEIELPSGQWLTAQNCLVDTGSSFVVLSTEWAEERGIHVPSTTSTMPLITAAGSHTTRVRDADLRVRFRRLSEYPFELAVVFSDSYPPTAPPLIGLHNLLNYWRFTFDGHHELAALMGHMRFETL
jgi:hypothetical protein